MAQRKMIRIATTIIGLFVGWPILQAPAVHELPTVERWRLRPSLPENYAILESGPRLAPLSMAIFWRESKFDCSLLSSTDDGGCFQLHKGTAEYLGVEDWLDPVDNIDGAVRLLNDGYRKYGTYAGAACHFAHSARCGSFK